jgi:P27 family predicted phage terminase small subunit
MDRPRQPIALVEAKGKKHLTKSEIAERQAREVQPVAENIIAPGYLNKTQKDEFDKIANQLQKLKIMGETDIDALARYVVANTSYIHSVRQLRKKVVKDDPIKYEAWSKVQERYFKQCRACANDLGLTISSRCRLVVPEAKDSTPPKANKFKQFEKSRVVGG